MKKRLTECQVLLHWNLWLTLAYASVCDSSIPFCFYSKWLVNWQIHKCLSCWNESLKYLIVKQTWSLTFPLLLLLLLLLLLSRFSSSWYLCLHLCGILEINRNIVGKSLFLRWSICTSNFVTCCCSKIIIFLALNLIIHRFFSPCVCYLV